MATTGKRAVRTAALRKAAETIAPGTTVRVYRNLHDDVFSVKAKINGRWIVIAHTLQVSLTDVTFDVKESDRDKVRATGRKGVHAWTHGKWATSTPDLEWVYVRYNPYSTDYWTNSATGQQVRSSDVVIGLTEQENGAAKQRMYIPA
jgi:hypothetical protein